MVTNKITILHIFLAFISFAAAAFLCRGLVSDATVIVSSYVFYILCMMMSYYLYKKNDFISALIDKMPFDAGIYAGLKRFMIFILSVSILSILVMLSRIVNDGGFVLHLTYLAINILISPFVFNIIGRNA